VRCGQSSGRRRLAGLRRRADSGEPCFIDQFAGSAQPSFRRQHGMPPRITPPGNVGEAVRSGVFRIYPWPRHPLQPQPHHPYCVRSMRPQLSKPVGLSDLSWRADRPTSVPFRAVQTVRPGQMNDSCITRTHRPRPPARCAAILGAPVLRNREGERVRYGPPMWRLWRTAFQEATCVMPCPRPRVGERSPSCPIAQGADERTTTGLASRHIPDEGAR